ncbi:transposase [Frateuria sp. GZRR35]|uniref:transposase n=1 Tax=Frateuria sp. GZRR35 TaxID=3351536 RepID=UPI003EDC601F
MKDAFRRHEVALHAFVLMDNHVHLLVDGPSARGVSMAMRRLGQCYVQSFNLKHRARKRVRFIFEA